MELVWYLKFLSHKSTRSIATIAGEPFFLSDHLNDVFTGVLCKEKRCEGMYITQEQNTMTLVRAGTVVCTMHWPLDCMFFYGITTFCNIKFDHPFTIQS